MEKNPLKVLEDVYAIILDRKANPKEGSYTNYLFDKGLDKILKKMGEEASEIIIAAKNPDPGDIRFHVSYDGADGGKGSYVGGDHTGAFTEVIYEGHLQAEITCKCPFAGSS